MKSGVKYLYLALAGTVLFSGCANAGTMEMPPMEKAVMSVETTILTKGIIGDTRSYSGTVEYSESYTVSPEISGKVETVNYKEGDVVKEGDILFTISDKDIQNNIAQLTASASSANAGIQSSQTALAQVEGGSKANQIAALENSVSMAEFSLSSSQTAVSQAETRLNTANDTYEQNKLLFEAGAIPKQTLETSERDLNSARDAYDEAKRALEKAENDLASAKKSYNTYVNVTLPETKQNAQNSLNMARASASTVSVQIEQAKENLDNTSVKSHVSGTISARNVEPGSFVTNSTPAITIINTNTVTVKVNVTEQIISGLAVGDKVAVSVSSLNGEKLEGTVTAISPVTDQSRTYPVEVGVANHGDKLVFGMHARVAFMKDISDNALVVPVETVLSDENSKYVYVVENGKAKRVNVETGIENAEGIQLTSGVSENDKVITKGQSSVRDGDEVNVVNTGAMPAPKPIDESTAKRGE